MRVLPDGTVVSDSHNYRKNEIAARKIEMELQLNTVIPSPPETRPSDRHALVNASRRAARRGTSDPAKIDAQAVRDALGKAQTRVHLEKLLAELGLEAEFDRRGQAREIYGWRLRRQGVAEWFKASTLAKDLSWPKIAHRFAETDSAEEIQAGPGVAFTTIPAQPVPGRGDRMPAAAKSILFPPLPVSANQIIAASGRAVAVSGQYKPIFDLEKMQRLEAGPLSTAMLILGGALVNFSVELARKIIWFMQRILSQIGLGMRPVMPPRSEPRDMPVLAYEPMVPAENKEVLAAMNNAATRNILKLLDSVDKKDTSLLPKAEGWEEVAAAMDKEFSITAGAEIQPADAPSPAQSAAVLSPKFPLNLNQTSSQTAAAPETLLTPAKTDWMTFEETANQFKAAHTAVQRAREKDIFYIDTRPAITRELTPVQAGLVKLEGEFLAWRGAHKMAAVFGSDPMKFGQKILNQKAEIARLKDEFQSAEKKHAEFEKLWAATPEPVVPAALLNRKKALILSLREHHAFLLSKAKNDLKILAENPFSKSIHQTLMAKIRQIEDRLDQFLVRPQKNFLTDFQATLQEVRMQTSFEKAKFAQPSDWIEEAPMLAPGQK